LEEKMKGLRVAIITIVVIVLIFCATTAKAQNVEIDRTARATELIAEGIALLNAEYSERADELVTEAEKRTAGPYCMGVRICSKNRIYFNSYSSRS